MNIVAVPETRRDIMNGIIREVAALISVTVFISSIGVLSEVVRMLI
jgi:hypothetical protein